MAPGFIWHPDLFPQVNHMHQRRSGEYVETRERGSEAFKMYPAPGIKTETGAELILAVQVNCFLACLDCSVKNILYDTGP